MDNENEEIEVEEKPENQLNQIGVVLPLRTKHRILPLNIIGQIEGHTVLPSQNKTTKYEHIIPILIAAEQDLEIEGILITLNTVGGDVEAGLAIAEIISTLSKPTVSLVTGGGHSIGVPLAVASDYSFITESATMTLHPIRMSGMVIGATQTYEYFNKVQQQVMSFIEKHSHIKKNKLERLMLSSGNISNDIGIILFGAEAVEKGIINAVGGIADAFNKLHELIEKK